MEKGYICVCVCVSIYVCVCVCVCVYRQTLFNSFYVDTIVLIPKSDKV